MSRKPAVEMNSKGPEPAPAATRCVPQTSVSVDWILSQVGPLIDGSVSSMRFRENLESAAVTLVDLEAWMLQALQPPRDALHLHAVQDLIHAVAKRMGLKVQYGNYEPQTRGWLPFDGLWWLDSRNFVCVDIHPERLTTLDLAKMHENLEKVRGLGGIFAESQGTVALVLAEGYSADLDARLRSPQALQTVRLLGIDTLFDIARMRAEGVLSLAQMPVLFSPFDSLRLGQVVDFLERFVARCDDPSGHSTASAPVLASPANQACAPHGVAAPAQQTGLSQATAQSSAGATAGSPGTSEPPPSETARLEAEVTAGERAVRLETLKEVFALFKAGQHDECLRLLERYLGFDDSNPKAWEIFGDIASKTGRHGDAIRAYARVLALAPGGRVISYRLASLYESQGDLREAVRVLDALARANPEAEREARWSAAQMLSRGRDFRGCLTACDWLLQKGPWDRVVVELRDQCRRHLGLGRGAVPPSPPKASRIKSWFGSLVGQGA